MAIHVDFEASAAGATWQNVKCEKCGKHYHYPLVRDAKASVRAAYGLGQASAEDRAAKTAEYRLMKLLEKGVDLVPCPACGWYQDDMVREGKRRTARWLIGIAVLCFVAGLAFTAYPVGEQLFDPEANVTPDQWHKAIIAFCAGVAGGIAALFVRRMIQSTVNPNARYRRPPEPIPGMPVGISGKAPRDLLGRTTAADVTRHESFGDGLIR